MIETGTGAAAYYTDIMQAVVNLALAAPGGPPPDAASFLDRLDVAWLETAYGDGLHEAALTRIRAAKNHVGDIQLRYATLLGRLGPALDGPGTLDGADAWYCILEGTREPSVAEAQAMALTEVVAHAATSADRERRAILLAADDYSAVSRRVPISNLYERGRSLGLGVQVSAQSWQGLGRDDDERYRIAATADGRRASRTPRQAGHSHPPQTRPDRHRRKRPHHRTGNPRRPVRPRRPSPPPAHPRPLHRPLRPAHHPGHTASRPRTTPTQQASDPSLLDELPFLGDILTSAPVGLTERLLDAFDVQAVYNRDKNQVTIHATLTDTTPQAIKDLLTDPRADHNRQPASAPAPQDHVGHLTGHTGSSPRASTANAA